MKFPNVPNDPVDVYGIYAPRATVPFWDDPPQTLDPSNAHASPWDVCVLNGIPFPGLCVVQSKTKKRLDVKKAKGGRCATLTFTGNDPADVMITCRIWTPTHLDQLQSVIRIIQPKPNAKSFTAVDIYHPALSVLGINSVVVQFIDALQATQVKGVWEMKLQALEYTKPSKQDVTKTADGSTDFTTVPHAIQAGASEALPEPSETDTGPFGNGLKLIPPG